MDFLDALASGISTTDEAHGRVYGFIPGIVTDVDTKLMRIKARIGKQGDNESTDWLIPMGMGSVESLPEVNDPIGVMFQDGDVHRGAYFYFPQSTTNKRPASPVPLGDVMAGIINNLANQLKDLKSDVTALYVLVNTTGLVVTGGTANASPTLTQTVSAVAPAKCQASDGSSVSPVTADSKALSKRTRVR